MTYKEVMVAVIIGLDQPRDRTGKLRPDIASGEPMRKLTVQMGLSGGQDRIEQAVNLMRAFLQREP